MHHIDEGFRWLMTKYLILVWYPWSHIIDFAYNLFTVTDQLSFIIKVIALIYQVIFVLKGFLVILRRLCFGIKVSLIIKELRVI